MWVLLRYTIERNMAAHESVAPADFEAVRGEIAGVLTPLQSIGTARPVHMLQQHIETLRGDMATLTPQRQHMGA